ncbi:MAG: PKD domain-containing protein, partial [Bacteroidetes bacterium]|nr:PKD domain-containing protein [Bacteroidota bacterium]
DNATGIVSGNIGFPYYNAYGPEFSPSSKLLYVFSLPLQGPDISQYDVSLYDSAIIVNSQVPIGLNVGSVGGLQLGPDDKIYFIKSFTNKLGVINFPDHKGIGCNLVEDYIDLSPAAGSYGLPAFVPDLVVSSLRRAKFTWAADNGRCATVNFSGSSPIPGPVIYEWDFGDGSTATGQNVSHMYTGMDSAVVKLAVGALTVCNTWERVTSIRKIAIPASGIRAGFLYGTPCVNTPISFTDSSTVANPGSWSWDFGDGSISFDKAPVHTYSSAGTFSVQHSISAPGGCQASVIKAVTIEQPHINAGNDTLVAIGQPLQLNATGAASYSWSPATWLSNTASATPVSHPQSDITYVLNGITAIGCTGYDTLHVKVYKGPDIYVPKAFTPDGNGHNDLLMHILPGLQRLDYFSVYNRLGQLVFSTTRPGEGWNGRFNGAAQPAGVFVWILQWKDYLGVTRQGKGTTMLIR